MKPKDFGCFKKKYPVFMYQYSGPGSQQVSNQIEIVVMITGL
jgi:dipeptidyl-peptidase-4